jgi:serine phosphatase RsbU (regulator of sigma subunit)
MLYLTTDGFIDQFGGPKNKKFGTKRLISALNRVCSEPIEIQRKALIKEHNKWQGEQEQIDDITLIGIRF